MFLKQQHIVLAQPSPLSATALLRGSCFEVPLFLRRDHWVVGVLRVGSTFQFFTSGLLGRNKKTFISILPRSHHPLLPSVRRGDAFNPFLRFFSAKDAGLLLVCRWLSTATLLHSRELFPQRRASFVPQTNCTLRFLRDPASAPPAQPLAPKGPPKSSFSF